MENKLDADKISKMIDMAREAIDRSDFGPFLITNADNLNQKNITPVNWQIYLQVLGSLLIKNPNEIDFSEKSSLLN